MITRILPTRFLCVWNPLRCGHGDNVVRRSIEIVARLPRFHPTMPTRDHAIGYLILKLQAKYHTHRKSIGRYCGLSMGHPTRN